MLIAGRFSLTPVWRRIKSRITIPLLQFFTEYVCSACWRGGFFPPGPASVCLGAATVL
jgi:hypothetical protein